MPGYVFDRQTDDFGGVSIVSAQRDGRALGGRIGVAIVGLAYAEGSGRRRGLRRSGRRSPGAESGGRKAPGAGHGVGQSVPGGDRVGLVGAAHPEPRRATVAGMVVDAFGRTRTPAATIRLPTVGRYSLGKPLEKCSDHGAHQLWRPIGETATSCCLAPLLSSIVGGAGKNS